MGDKNKERPVSEQFIRKKEVLTRTRTRSIQGQTQKELTRQRSISGGLEDLVQCGICLETVTEPRMLQCQHTFCLNCLDAVYSAKNQVISTSGQLSEDKKYNFICPTCKVVTNLPHVEHPLKSLPTNVYIDCLLKLIPGPALEEPAVQEGFSCVKCQTVLQNQKPICQHCAQIFCNICWNDHMADLNTNLLHFFKQLEDSQTSVTLKIDECLRRYEQMKEHVKNVTKEKIDELKKQEMQVFKEIDSYKKGIENTLEDVNLNVNNLKNRLLKETNTVDSNKVSTFLNLHQESSSYLNEMLNLGDSRLTFDSETYTLEEQTEKTFKDFEENFTINGVKINQPSEPFNPMTVSVDVMVFKYKSRPFEPKLKWYNCPRPAGVGVPPWDMEKLYIAATDSGAVLIMNRNQNKVMGRLTHEEMLCPVSLTFSKDHTYISDNWNHCIHVFSNTEDHEKVVFKDILKNPDGIAIGPNGEIVISDNGNNRILILDPLKEEVISEIYGLNNPMGLCVYKDKIIIADTGNHKIKTCDFSSKMLHEFGSFGKNHEQFRSAEVVTVDSAGTIFVGDSGNGRVQIFTPDGDLIRIFGVKSGFQWVSGIHIAPSCNNLSGENDIILTDHKARSLMIF